MSSRRGLDGRKRYADAALRSQKLSFSSSSSTSSSSRAERRSFGTTLVGSTRRLDRREVPPGCLSSCPRLDCEMERIQPRRRGVIAEGFAEDPRRSSKRFLYHFTVMQRTSKRHASNLAVTIVRNALDLHQYFHPRAWWLAFKSFPQIESHTFSQASKDPENDSNRLVRAPKRCRLPTHCNVREHQTAPKICPTLHLSVTPQASGSRVQASCKYILLYQQLPRQCLKIRLRRLAIRTLNIETTLYYSSFR